MASPQPLRRHAHRHLLHPSPSLPIPLTPCCCVHRILLHHQHHHHLFHRRPLPPWASHGSHPVLVPHPGACPPPTLPPRGDQCGVTAQDAGNPGDSQVVRDDILSNRLLEETWTGELEDEQGDDEEGEEYVYVLTDEWAEFFAKSEAKRLLERKKKKQKQKQQKGSI
uniref:Transducin-like enhancer protein 1 n=1 Tax=Anthurium amnicola TaxID=1678845 RepID=A0A1D1Z8U0_9ARAE